MQNVLKKEGNAINFEYVNVKVVYWRTQLSEHVEQNYCYGQEDSYLVKKKRKTAEVWLLH